MSPSRGITSKRQSLLFAIATVAILHLIVYRSTSSLRQLHHTTLSHSKRSLSPLVEGSHSEPTTDALIDWYSLYRDASKRHKPFVFGAMTVWLVFLFAFVGICASEFFCPNLSHIASRLGLSESVAGVTFLAFSNGSPDVFSTFSALKSNAGSLAIGELIGAASFIVSVVAGTMALITPFRVARHTFLRDVGFFTLAVLMTLAILYDSHIHLWEALTMVGLYFVYVAWVAVGGWWWSRREDKRRKVREAREEYDHTRGGAGIEELGGGEEEEGEGDQVGAFGSGAEIEWEREEEEVEGDHGVIHLPVSGSTTPRSTTGRSITSAFSSDSIIYHPTSSTSRTHSHTRGGGGGGAVTPPIPPTMNSPRLPRHHSHSHHHFRSRSTSLINPSATTTTTMNRPPPTPLSGLGNSISSLDGVTSSSTTTSAPGTIGGVGGGGGKRLRPSLLGAIEFRDFVNSLNQDKNNATNLLSVFGGGSGGTKEIGGKKKKRPGHSRTTSTFSSSSNAGGGGGNWSRGNSPRSERGASGNGTEWNWNRGWPNRTGEEEGGEGRRRASSSPGFRPDFPAAMGKGGGRGGQLRLGGGEDTLANGVLNRRQGGGGSLSSSSEEDEGEEENPWVRAVREQDEAEEETRAKIKKVPSILLTSENGSDVLIATPSPSSTPILPSGSASSFSSTTVRPSAISTTKNDYYSLAAKDDDRRRTSQRRSILFRSILASLFPSLSQFSSKSIIGKITALLCVPALLVLNLTLPVAEEVREDEQDELNEDGTCDWGEGRREEDEVEKEENERRRRRIPKGIELPEDESDGTGLGGGLGQGDGERGEEHAGDAAERVGKRLHSPAVAHHDPHAHSHSHHLATASVEPPSPLLLDFEDDLDGPLEIDGPVTSPWLDQVSNPPPPAATTSQESNHHRFRIASELEGSTAVNRISSESSSTERPDSPTQSRELGGAGENDDEDETESLILDKMECEAARKVTRGLTAVQCTLGPVFCACALFADELEWYQPLLALCLGLFFATLSYRFFHNPRHPGRVSLCFIGFGIAMVWILMIVNEVVGVLQTLGHIFGISDAILGLTIFAMGNSLGDLVANATVARMGYPSMAIAACFGGPMLNILLGVGLSGTYLIALSPTHEPIHVEMGRTLMVSGVGLFAILLGSLIVVPMNGYRMTKRIGAILIGAYTVVLSINVAAEIWL